MAETIPIFQKNNSPLRHNNNIEKNLSYAREWYKKQKWPSTMKINLSDAGSSVFGTIKKATLNLNFMPDWNDIWPNLSIPISTLQDELDFRGALNIAYENVMKHHELMEKKRAEGKLKQKSDLPKRNDSGSFKALKK